MKRSLKELTRWEEYEKKLLEKKSFKKVAHELEYEYVLAKNLIQLRIKNKLSQQELAQKSGMKQPVISRIETGATKPTLSTLERIAKALGVRLEIKLS